jgi:hypothetical protein
MYQMFSSISQQSRDIMGFINIDYPLTLMTSMGHAIIGMTIPPKLLAIPTLR